jgi:hypothetical protein
MRINKRLVPDRAYHRDYWGNKKEYVDCKDLSLGLLLVLLVSGLFALGVWGVIQWSKVPSSDAKRFNHECSIIAQNKQYFVVHSSSQNHEAACIVAPNWTSPINL